jgi:hypothetical protein
MFVFVFQPKANRETLREFNARLQEFCADNPVVSIDACAFGPNLIIQGVTADDTDSENVPTFTAVVRTLEPDDTDLEEQLDGLIDQEKMKHDAAGEDGDPNLPMKVVVVETERRSWAVLLCINGVAEDGGDEGDDDDDGPEEVAPAGSPAAGFAG